MSKIIAPRRNESDFKFVCSKKRSLYKELLNCEIDKRDDGDNQPKKLRLALPPRFALVSNSDIASSDPFQSEFNDDGYF